MKRIGDNPLRSKNYSEGVSFAKGHIIPRSGNSEGASYFPFTKYKEKYIDVNETKYRNTKTTFTKCINGVWEGTIAVSSVGKGGQALDKVYCYDVDTGADFSMDVECIEHLLHAVADGRCFIKREGEEVHIQGQFTLRAHFLVPYSNNYEETLLAQVEQKEETKNSKLKASQYIDGNFYVGNGGYGPYQWFKEMKTIYVKNFNTSNYYGYGKSRLEVVTREIQANKFRIDTGHLNEWQMEQSGKSWAYGVASSDITIETMLEGHNKLVLQENEGKENYRYTLYSLTPFV